MWYADISNRNRGWKEQVPLILRGLVNNQGAHTLLKQPPKAPASAAPNGDNFCTGFNVSWTFTLFPYSSFPLCDYSCVDHMINIISSSLLLSLPFQYSALSMPITFRSYLVIISETLPYCPMLLSFILSTQPLTYLIIFVLLTFRLIVLRSALFLLDVLLHLSLGIVPHCHSY